MEYLVSLFALLKAPPLGGTRFIIPTVGLAAPFGFRVDHEVLEAVVEKPGPSLMNLHPQVR